MTDAWVISDVHLGGGPTDPLEDFRADDALVAFVDNLERGSTLVLNGDIVEFVQAPPAPTDDYFDGLPSHLLWTANVSVGKLKTVLRAHHAVFNALGTFVADNDGRVIFTIGNHDLDFAFAETQTELRRALGNPPSDRFDFVVGQWRHNDVVIQHGHQATPENCPAQPNDFVHTFERRGRREDYLERVWGTDFLLQWYNAFELTHPYADNVKPTSSALFGALTATPRLVGLRDFLRLLVFLKRRGLPPAILGAVLETSPELDAATVVGSVETPEWQAVLIDSDPQELDAAIDLLTAEERAVLAAAGDVELPEPDPLDQRETAETLGLFTSSREHGAAHRLLAMGGTEAVVFGHTHKMVDGALGNRLYNPGCWIPHLDLADPAVKQRVAEIGFCEELVRDGSLYTSTLRAVRVREGTTRSKVELVTIHEDR